MCAIAGMISLPAEKSAQKKMLATMARRGTDDAGSYENGNCCLLHTRLAIIDPQKRTLHDFFAKTRVVYAPKSESKSKPENSPED